MAKGDCKRRVVRFGKRAARFLGPVLGALVPQAVGFLEMAKEQLPSVFGGHEKRRFVLEIVKTRAKEMGHEAYDGLKDHLTSQAESYVRAHIENSLENLRLGQPIEKLQNWATDPDLEESDED
jgi:hypothetical protein